jgi:predicted ATPase
LPPGEPAEATTTLARFLSRRRQLLVLDNFEHLMDAAADIAALTREAGDVQVLVTSREALRVRGEHVYRVSPLATHDDEETASPAVALFLARAEEAGAQLDAAESLPAIAEICDRLDGLPLAIELAAARTVVLSPEAVLDRLGHRLGLLTAGGRDAPERQQSLRACVEWSVELLAPEDRRLLALMSVFAGGCTMEGLESVCAEVLPGVDALTGVDSLVAKSLVAVTPAAAGQRFAMLETIREYAGVLLPASGGEPRARAAHARWVVALLSSPPGTVSRRPRNVRERAMWADELPDARAALSHLQDAGEYQAAADLAAGVATLWKMRGDWAELEGWAMTLADRAEVSDDRRAELLAWAAFVAMILGRLAESSEHVEQGFALTGPDRFPVQRVRLHLAACSVSFVEGDLAQTGVEVLEALDIARATGDVELVALATSYQLTPLTREDIGIWERAVAAARAAGDQNQECNLCINFSELSIASEDPDIVKVGVDAALTALDVAETLADLGQQAAALDNAGANFLVAGSPQAAAAHLRSALRLGARLGDSAIQVESLVRLAAAEAALGHLDVAGAIYADWFALGEGWPRGAGPANQRLIDTFLTEVRDEHPAYGATGGDVSLTEAVERALAAAEAQ